ncbi:MAG TPA: nuclear transport factor 2 family protein [Candidatus Sulfotelmatobacter sp.]
MRMTFAAVACLLFVVMAATAQEIQKAPAKSIPNAAPALEPKIRKVWEDFKNKNKDALAAALSDEFREVEEGGSGFGDKKAEIAMVDDFEISTYTLKDFKVRPLGTHAALVTYLAHYEGKSGGQPSKSDSAFGEVWVHEGKDWKALYVQETAVK